MNSKQKANKQNAKLNGKGITLIALVVTIVVLLILAGVSINLIVGQNGIIKKTKDARIATKRGEIEDYATLKIADLYVSNPLNTEDINDATILTALKSDLMERGYEIKDINTTNETVTDIALTVTDSTGNNISAITLQQQQSTTVKVGLNINSQLLKQQIYVKIEDNWYEIIVKDKTVKVSTEKFDMPKNPPENTYEIKITPPSSSSGITMTALGKTITSDTPITPGTNVTIKAGNSTGTFPFTVRETVSSKSKNVNVTVSANPSYAQSLSLTVKDNAAKEITPGGELQLVATKNPASSSDTIVWSIKPGSASASVSSKGLVTANSAATAGSTIVVAANCKRSDNTATTVAEQTLTITVKSTGLSVGDIVDTSKTRVGYYADLEGNDGVPEGIIYADLAFSFSDQWGGSNGAFSYTAKTGLKEYVVTKATYNDGHFGDAPVIAPKSGTSGNDRFYVMALNDFDDSNYYYWDYNYNAGNLNIDYGTSGNFETGRNNTETLINYWDNNYYAGSDGSQITWSDEDIWANIQTQYNNDWFVPSRAEWAAFAKNLGITTSNYRSKGLISDYWSSSQGPYNGNAWIAGFDRGRMIYGTGTYYSRVRLSTTF